MPEQPPRVVFDCNIFVQGIANRHSPARKALRLFFDGSVLLFVSDAVLREVRDVLYRPELRRHLSGLNDRLIAAFFTQIEAKAILLKNVPEEYHYERDPDDEMYLNLALAANVTYLVSKDNDLLDLMKASTEVARQFRLRYPFLHIMRAADFVKEIGTKIFPS